MKQHHAHNLLMIFGVAIFLMTAALYVYMYIATDSQTAKVVEARDAQLAQELETKQIEGLKNTFKNSEKSRSALSDLFVKRNDVVKFIENLESLGTDSGAVVEIGSVNEISEGGSPVGKFKAHIEAKGSWAEVSKVLFLLETMQKSISIDSVRFNSLGGVDGSSKSSIWGLSLNIIANTI